MYLNLVFKEYIQFLKDKGIDTNKYNLTEGYFWLDKQIIKCYDIEGNIHKILRLHIDDNLNITVTDYKNKEFEIESWQDTIKRNKSRLEELEIDAKKLIRKSLYLHDGYEPICTVSGGKDSAVVKFLLDQVIKDKDDLKLIFNNTTNETHITYKYIKENYPNARTLTPPIGFYPLIKKYNTIPSRFNRFCCTLLKENVTINQLNQEDKLLFFMGMRKEESTTRSGYKSEWKNERWKGDNWQGILPILEWTEEDIWLYILKNNIPINQLYKFGFKRVGCTFCPYRSSSELALSKYFLPIYYKRWEEVLTRDFILNGKASILNCSLNEYLNGAWKAGVVREEVTDDIIKEFAEYKNISFEMAQKYFNKTCGDCGKKLKKDEIAMFLKRNGRFEGYEDNRKYLCKTCFCKEENITKKEYKEQIDKFKNQGCTLF